MDFPIFFCRILANLRDFRPARAERGGPLSLGLFDGLEQLDAVAERIIGIRPVMRLRSLVIADRDAGCSETRNQAVQAVHYKGGMGLAGWPEVGIHAEVDLDAVILEPAATSPLQMGRLWHPCEAE